MKKITFLFATLFAVIMVNAQVLLDENFPATFPNPQAVSTTLTDATSGWTTVTGAVSTTFSKTTTTAMTYPPVGTTWINSGIGNSLYVNYTGVSSASSYSYKTFSASALTSGVVYLSFLYKCTANGGSGSQIIGLSDLSSSGNSGVTVYCSYVSGTGLKLGVTRGSATNGDVQFGSTTITLGTVYFIVMKYDFTAAKATLYINPTIGGSESGATVWSFDDGTVNLKSARTSLQYLKVCNSGSNKAYFNVSGARVSQSWSDAVAPYVSALPALTTPSANSAQNITDQGFTANWSNTDVNATGYSVKVYSGTNLIPVNTTTAGAGATSVAVTGLMSGLDYTYKVTATGDNVNYQNSAESAGSSFTTTGRVSSLNTDFGNLTWGTVYNTSTAPVTGSYPSSYENGFELNKAVPYYTSNATGPKGEVHSTLLKVDKNTYGGNVVLPTISSVSQLEIHAYPATAPRDFYLKQYINGSWVAVGPGSNGTTGTYTMSSSSDAIFIIPITANNTNAKFRIENGGAGGINILQVISRTTTPTTLSTPTVGSASAINLSSITANWTPVSNATNYEVKVYKGATLKVTTSTTEGQAASSLNITGLQADSTYTYKVKAIGDGDLSYSDSYQSATSASFTMAHQLATPVVGTASTSATGITANWTNAVVTNVLSYDIKIYQGTTLVKTVNVPDPNATSVNINGLEYATEYTFTVTAIGDNISNFNSAESAKSTAATTDLGTGIIPADNTFRLYTNNTEVICSEAGNFVIFSIQGAKVMELKNVSRFTTNLNSGVYLIKFSNSKEQTSLVKLIIR